jgi:hypothetical protein
MQPGRAGPPGLLGPRWADGPVPLYGIPKNGTRLHETTRAGGDSSLELARFSSPAAFERDGGGPLPTAVATFERSFEFAF